jgi:hypothetical protein
MAPDDGVAHPEAVQQAERLGEVACGDRDVVALGAQGGDDRAQHEHVRAVGEVDPDAHAGAEAIRCPGVHGIRTHRSRALDTLPAACSSSPP